MGRVGIDDLEALQGLGLRHEERADVWSFFLWQFGDPAFQPK